MRPSSAISTTLIARYSKDPTTPSAPRTSIRTRATRSPSVATSRRSTTTSSRSHITRFDRKASGPTRTWALPCWRWSWTCPGRWCRDPALPVATIERLPRRDHRRPRPVRARRSIRPGIELGQRGVEIVGVEGRLAEQPPVLGHLEDRHRGRLGRPAGAVLEPARLADERRTGRRGSRAACVRSATRRGRTSSGSRSRALPPPAST